MLNTIIPFRQIVVMFKELSKIYAKEVTPISKGLIEWFIVL